MSEGGSCESPRRSDSEGFYGGMMYDSKILLNPSEIEGENYETHGSAQRSAFDQDMEGESYETHGSALRSVFDQYSVSTSDSDQERSEQESREPESYEHLEWGINKAGFVRSADLFDTASEVVSSTEEGEIKDNDSINLIKGSSDRSNSDEFTRTSTCPHDYPTCVPNLPEVTKIEAPTPFTFASPIASWERVFKKYSPSTETQLSPVKHISANIAPNVVTDAQVNGMVWICGMGEQFYYDNGINMLQKYLPNELQLKIILRMNSTFVDPEENLKNLVDVHILGSGSFGDVYRVRNKFTDEFYAVKFLKKSRNSFFTQHTDSLLSYLKEKNYLIHARKSPYIVQFISSATYPKVSGLFLFFEWCLCDLRKFVKLVTWKGHHKQVTQELWENVKEGITDIFVNVHQYHDIDLLIISLIYIFEIFCALSFMADCNLVHQDLKPENIMISTTLHLKIADFGLAYNTKFITRRSQIHLVDPSEIDRYESANYRPQLGGTILYQDMEMCYGALESNAPMSFYAIKNDEDHFQEEMREPKDVDSDFLNDLWACGIMTIELLFGGIHPFYSKHMSESVSEEMGLKNYYYYDVLKITYNSKIHTRYLIEGFLNYVGDDLYDLMFFVISIFRPREVRALGFTKFKEVYRYDRKITLSHIDINKVEEIDVFRNLNLHNHNSFLYQLPEELKDLLTNETTPEFSTMGTLLDSIISEKDDKFFTLDPGIQQSFF